MTPAPSSVAAVSRSASRQDARESGSVPQVGMPANGGSAGLDPDALADVWEGGRDGGEVELLGLVFGECEQHCLDVGDLSGDRGGVELVAVGDQLAFLGRGERLGGQEAVQRGLWLVVETLAAAGLVLAPADRLLGRGEVVEPVVDELNPPGESGDSTLIETMLPHRYSNRYRRFAPISRAAYLHSIHTGADC